MQLQTERNSSLRVLGGRALVQTSIKVAANRRPYRPYRPWQSLPPSLEWTEVPFKGGIGDLVIPNRRKGRIIQDLEDHRSHAPNLRRTTLSRARNRLSKRRDRDVWPT